MIPGPVDADEATLSAFGAPTRPHYGSEWMPTYRDTCRLLQKLFETTGDVLMVPGPGTAAIDAAVGSLVPANCRICIPTNGFFGDRLCEQARAYNVDVLAIPFLPGVAIDPERVRRILEEQITASKSHGGALRAIAVVHHETSTGILNPIRELSGVAQEFGLLMIVDAVSSIGGLKIAVDAWNIDACIGVGNKCLGVPPGVAMLSVSQRAWKAAEDNPGKHGWFLDLRTWKWYRENWTDWFPYPATLPTNNVMALHNVLSALFVSGIESHWARIADAAHQVRKRMKPLGFTPFVAPESAAPMMTAFVGPGNVDLVALSAFLLKEHRILVAGGIEDLKGKILRVGHMGRACSTDYVDALIFGVVDFLKGTRT
jgi:alanine-glyoxylate transaminase / serine-glyoxylate transaminase / serine-pyruvate transaminase